MEVVGANIVLWADFDDEEELDKFIEDLKPRLVKRVMVVNTLGKCRAHLDIQYKDYPMYVVGN